MYHVVKAPQNGGSVYTVALGSDLGKVHQVHHTALKPRAHEEAVLRDVPESWIGSPVLLGTEVDPKDGDLASVMSEAPLVAQECIIGCWSVNKTASLVEDDEGHPKWKVAVAT